MISELESFRINQALEDEFFGLHKIENLKFGIKFRKIRLYEKRKTKKKAPRSLLIGLNRIYNFKQLYRYKTKIKNKICLKISWNEILTMICKTTLSQIRQNWFNRFDPRLTLKKWTVMEKKKLKTFVVKTKCRGWKLISKEVGKRHPFNCYKMYHRIIRKNLHERKGPWTNKEEEYLELLVHKFGEKEWKLIASKLIGRTPEQILHRWTRTTNSNIFHGRWELEDDFRLIMAMRFHSSSNYLLIDIKKDGNFWSNLTKYFPHKTDRKVRERWFNIVNCLNKISFTNKIDQKILFMIKYIFKGVCRSSEISKNLNTGHTSLQVYRRYKKLIRVRKILI